MGEADGVLGELDGVHDAPVAGVAQVDEDSQFVHLLDEAHAEALTVDGRYTTMTATKAAGARWSPI